MKIVLLSGGSGQRLWPLSNDAYSKQYIRFIKHDEEAVLNGKALNCSMLQRVFAQLQAVGLGDDVIIAASESQKDIIESQLGNEVKISVEPTRWDTFAAILLASSFIKTKLSANPDEVVCFVPIDPYVELGYFRKIIDLAEKVQKEEKCIGLLGAIPTYPAEKYGYIIAEKSNSDVLNVKEFVEKPTKEVAIDILKRGALWNCGVFCFRLDTAAIWAELHNVPFDYDELYKEKNYLSLPKRSFDYEILEKWDNRIVLSYDGIWKDIGTWNTLTEEMEERYLGNVIVDEQIHECHILNTLDIPVVVMGTNNLIVAASQDGILVSDKAQSSYLKQCLSKTKLVPRYEERRWGTIKNLDRQEEGCTSVCTNMIKVNAGQSTTYHRHLKHKEIITVISGKGILLYNGTKIILSPGVSFTINSGILHSIWAEEKLKYIEVLMGDLSEDDIERVGEFSDSNV